MATGLEVPDGEGAAVRLPERDAGPGRDASGVAGTLSGLEEGIKIWLA